MRSSLEIVTAPSSEPLTTADAKKHLVVDFSDDDDYIDDLVKAARELVEDETRMAVIDTEFKLRLDEIPDNDIIILGKFPVSAIGSVKYYDSDNTLQTVSSSDYYEDINPEEARIEFASRPTYKDRIAAIEIVFNAGYANAAAVPEEVKHVIRLLVGEWYENRTDVVHTKIRRPATKRILAKLKRWTF
jgi:uncharacterized phiE125 gp8 family phage protein